MGRAAVPGLPGGCELTLVPPVGQVNRMGAWVRRLLPLAPRGVAGPPSSPAPHPAVLAKSSPRAEMPRLPSLGHCLPWSLGSPLRAVSQLPGSLRAGRYGRG